MIDRSRQLRAAARPRPDVRGRRIHAGDESGVTIIEVVISAALMVIIAGFVFTTISSAGRAAAQERQRAQAFAIAQEDQARLRSLKISELSNLSQTSTVTQGGISYTVASTATPKIDRTTTSSCESGNSSADYIAISSRVTWPSLGGRPPALIESIVAPPSGSLAANRGALAVSIVDSRIPPNPYPGITIAGSGAGTFSGQTESTGCVIFGDLPAGNYTVTPALSGLVDPNGNPPAGKATSVVGQASNTLSFQYDQPGRVDVTFETRSGGSSSSLVASSADTITAFNTGMDAPKTTGTLGTRLATQTNSSLFPFTSPYSIWAGSCASNNPGSGLAMASVIVPVAGTVNTKLRLPALNLTVYNGSKVAADFYGNPALLGSPVAGARVTVTDRDVDCAVKRTLTTNSAGNLADQGLPYGSYDVCVSGPNGFDGTVEMVSTSNVVVQDPNNPASLSVYLIDGTPGSCP